MLGQLILLVDFRLMTIEKILIKIKKKNGEKNKQKTVN